MSENKEHRVYQLGGEYGAPFIKASKDDLPPIDKSVIEDERTINDPKFLKEKAEEMKALVHCCSVKDVRWFDHKLVVAHIQECHLEAAQLWKKPLLRSQVKMRSLLPDYEYLFDILDKVSIHS